MLKQAGQVLLRRSTRSRPILIPQQRYPIAQFRFASVKATGRSKRAAAIVDPPTSGQASTSSTISTAPPASSVSAVVSPADSLQTEGAGPSNSQHPFASVTSDADSITPTSSVAGSPTTSTSTDNTSDNSKKPVRTSNLPPPPVSSSHPLPHFMRHPFDTHAFVSYLEKSGFPSDRARTYMESVRQMIVKRSDMTKASMLGKEDQENAAYLFRAALSELRTELSVRSRNDGTALRATAGTIQREVDQLETKMKEDVQTLKHDIDMDMNNRKSDTSTELQAFDIAIEEINNKFTISLGDLRTEIESAKWDSTRRAISIIVLLVVAGVGVTLYTSPVPAPAPVAKVDTRPHAIMRDMAVGSDDDTVDMSDESISDEKLEKILRERVGRLETASKVIGEGRVKGKDKMDVDRI